jgi:hypothetical protein
MAIGLALEGVAALRVAYFEERATDGEADPTEADESEIGDDDLRAMRTDPALETRADLDDKRR